MKLLIVDDESIVRVGIKSIVQNARLDFSDIAEAADGASALETTRKLLPDIVLVDIKMPVMDGLTYIREARSLIPAGKFIILSCLNEFEHVKAAMKMGVSDYIIKTTIDSDELVEVLEKTRREITLAREVETQTQLEHTQNRLNRPLVIQACLNKLLDGHLQTEPPLVSIFQEIGLPFDSAEYCLVVGQFDKKTTTPSSTPAALELLSFAITNICQDIYPRYCSGYTFSRDGGTIVSILAPNPGLGSEYHVHGIMLEVIASANEYLGESISFGISLGNRSVADIPAAFEQAVSALQNRFYTGSGSICQYPVVYREALMANPVLAKDCGAAVVKALMALNPEEFDQAMDMVFGYLTKEPYYGISDVKSFFSKIVFDLFEQVREKGIIISLQEIETEKILHELMNSASFPELLAKFRTFAGKFLEITREYGNNHFSQLIQSIKDYVRNNLEGDITLSSAAEYVKMNPSYVSKIFKIRTGESFSDYLHKEKINRAKELIKQNEKIYLIAEKLGYADIASFSRAFKNTEGKSPQSYKRQMIGLEEK